MVVTAVDQKQALMDSIHDGAVDFIVKPFDRDRVLDLLSKLARLSVLTQSRPRGPCCQTANHCRIPAPRRPDVAAPVRVLVVDDSALMRRLLCDLLTSPGSRSSVRPATAARRS